MAYPLFVSCLDATYARAIVTTEELLAQLSI
jgi:hypothetical protein